MILDVEQRSKDIIISYYNKEGIVAFKQYPIKKFQNWYICDDKDTKASKEFKNWDGRSVKLSEVKKFNKFSLIYFLDGLPEKDKEELLEFNMPKTYFVDIETEIDQGLTWT